jgi:hypothetical protein
MEYPKIPYKHWELFIGEAHRSRFPHTRRVGEPPMRRASGGVWTALMTRQKML